jgi:hypothetical protein
MPLARSEQRKAAGVADFLDGHVAAQRGLLLVGGEHLAEALDAGGGQGRIGPADMALTRCLPGPRLPAR